MKKTMSLLLVLVLLLSLCACGAKPDTPKQAFEKALSTLRSGDIEAADPYFDGKLLEFLGYDDDMTASKMAGELLKATFASLKYEVKTVKVGEDSTVISATVVNKDIGAVLDGLQDRIFMLMLEMFYGDESASDMDEEELEEAYMSRVIGMLIEDIESETDMVSHDVEVEMAKDSSGNWTVVLTEELLALLSGGLFEVETDAG